MLFVVGLAFLLRVLAGKEYVYLVAGSVGVD